MLTYSNALASTRRLYAKVVSTEEAATYGLHGLRVEAYNRARAIDPLLAVAHGGWASVAHERYARFDVDDVLALPSAMLSGESETSVASAVVARLPLSLSHPSLRCLLLAKQALGSAGLALAPPLVPLRLAASWRHLLPRRRLLSHALA